MMMLQINNLINKKLKVSFLLLIQMVGRNQLKIIIIPQVKNKAILINKQEKMLKQLIKGLNFKMKLKT